MLLLIEVTKMDREAFKSEIEALQKTITQHEDCEHITHLQKLKQEKK